MCTCALHQVNAPHCCQTTCSSSHQILCQAAIICVYRLSAGPGLSAQGSVRPIRSHLQRRRQFLAAEWTLWRRFRGGCEGRAKRRNGRAPAARGTPRSTVGKTPLCRSIKPTALFHQHFQELLLPGTVFLWHSQRFAFPLHLKLLGKLKFGEWRDQTH